MVRRYFHRYMNDKHYNKKWGKQMGGYINEPIKDPVQESIDALNAAIDRLDKIINDMNEMGQDNGNNK
jgi:hypothetical protein